MTGGLLVHNWQSADCQLAVTLSNILLCYLITNIIMFSLLLFINLLPRKFKASLFYIFILKSHFKKSIMSERLRRDLATSELLRKEKKPHKSAHSRPCFRTRL